MDWIPLLISFLTGAGIGGVFVALVQHWLSRRAKSGDLLIEGRQEAFRGVFESLEDLELGWSEKKVKRLGFWIARIELLASKETIEATHAFRDTEPDTEDRKRAKEKMIESMRRDLKISS